MSRKPLTDKDGNVRALTREDICHMRPAIEILPAEFLEGMAVLRRQRGQRGPQKALVKRQIALRIDTDVLAAYQAKGPGWQTRMNEALRMGISKS